MGHSSVRAALIYQHLVNSRDHGIAGHVDDQIRRVKGRPPAAYLARERHGGPHWRQKIKAQASGLTPDDLGLCHALGPVGVDWPTGLGDFPAQPVIATAAPRR
ncbi:hypothetical protein [Actinacidiphila sp. bgisy167]|uniref:hypothetical protein n=1 Tax=Actinacidiphila sp. bgisy167 TaxID=3413797 RepID=UPI003D741CEA